MGCLCKIAFITLIALGLCSCNASKKAHAYFEDHKDEFATDCADAFPVDSVSTKSDTVIIKANNIDYTGAIDSLSNSFDSLRNEKYEDSIKATISHEKCKEVVNDRGNAIARLKAQIEYLRSTYKPCEYDTVLIKTTYTIRDRAKEKSLQQQLGSEKVRSEKYKGKFLHNRTMLLITWLIVLIAVILYILSKRVPKLKAI